MDRRRRNCQPESPHLYRALVRVAEPIIRSVDPGSEVVVGELAPVGDPPISELTPMKPLVFMRSLGCVDNRYKSVRSGSCRGFKALRAQSFGYHPHPQKLAPDKVNPDVDEAQFADLRRLFTALDKLKARKRLRLGSTFHLTEFGYETSPPDSGERDLGGAADALSPAGGVHRVEVQAREGSVLLPVGRRADEEPRQWHPALLRLADRPPVQQRQAEAGAVDDAGAVRDRPGQGLAIRRAVGPGAGGRARGGDDQVKERGAADFRDLATLNTASDGTWSRRVTLISRAQYRYRWTPRPNAFVPTPFPKFSGVVDLGKTEKSQYKGSLAF